MKLTMEKAIEMMEKNSGNLDLNNKITTKLPDNLTEGKLKCKK